MAKINMMLAGGAVILAAALTSLSGTHLPIWHNSAIAEPEYSRADPALPDSDDALPLMGP